VTKDFLEREVATHDLHTQSITHADVSMSIESTQEAHVLNATESLSEYKITNTDAAYWYISTNTDAE
jgi:hypothetical protein